MDAFSDELGVLETLEKDKNAFYYSLPTFAKKHPNISRQPVIVRIMLESLMRNCDGKRVHKEDVLKLARHVQGKGQEGDVPFIVSRVLLQDFTGVPLVVDLAAMRDAAAQKGFDPLCIEPQVPVDLVIDHSVQVDRASTEDAFAFNLEIEFSRNKERYLFLKWGSGAYHSFSVMPPGMGICHQVNLEFLATVVTEKKVDGKRLLYPDTLVGTDSHTTMVNGLGVLGWGVGGIEAQAAMLNQPVAISFPQVIGVHLKGSLQKGVTATDLTLRITEMLRKEKVVGKFIEFFGQGAANLSVADRATIGNMAPEYGATTGFFPVDEKTLDYLRITGRSKEQIERIKNYLTAQGLFGMPQEGAIDYEKVLTLDLTTIVPCVAGPKRPQDRIALEELKTKFYDTLKAPIQAQGYGKGDEKPPFVAFHSDGTFSLKKEHETGGVSNIGNATSKGAWSEAEMVTNRPLTKASINPGYSQAHPNDKVLTHGSIVIAAITSCTNTSNPQVMIAAGLIAKRAVEKGLKINGSVKTSLAPGSRVVTDYLEKAGLNTYLDALGFQLVAYGCTTCIGNSGPLDEKMEQAIKEYDLITASVLSGNRNFEARIHGAVKANFLMSPPLVIAFALAGRIDIDLTKEPLGVDKEGKPVFLKEIWPSDKEIEEIVNKHLSSELFKKRYADAWEGNSVWKALPAPHGARYAWDAKNTYIQNPPYFDNFTIAPPSEKTSLEKMRCLALFGDSVTTDHISPAGGFKANSSAGQYLLSLGVQEKDFNSYGSRRGNHQVMMRGTFANVRIRNALAQGKEGGFTTLLPEGELMPIFDACQIYAKKLIPLIIFAGRDYGMGSSRDWAAKGTALLGVKVVVARSFERIHRSNLIGMGVLPLEFAEDESYETYGIKGDEVFSLKGLETLLPKQTVTLEIRNEKEVKTIPLRSRIDTPIEIDYYRHGGIMPYVLRQVLKK